MIKMTGHFPGRLIVLVVGLYSTLCTIDYLNADSSLITYNITCPDGWQQALNNCYYFNNVDQISWDEARTECALQDSDLLVITSQAELDWVNIQTEMYATDGWWVGLRYLIHWDWVQYGGDKTLINWRSEPDNFDGQQQCCAVNEFGEFSDEFCKNKLGFICSYNILRGEFCPSIPAPNSWYMSDKACYFVSPLLNSSFHLNWTAAQEYCLNLVQGKSCNLVYLPDRNESRGLFEFLSGLDFTGVMLPWWTGLNDLQTQGTYRWINGQIADGSLISWVVSPSQDRSQNKNCGLMYSGGSIQDTTCTKRAHYACERSAIQAQLNLGCPPGWMRGGESCYLLGEKGLTQQQADQVCSNVNSHLLQVDNLDEKIWIEGLPFNYHVYWTNLQRTSGPGGWAWAGVKEADLNLIKWNEEPNNSGGNEHCAEIRTDGTYNDDNCNSKVGYICESPLIPGDKCYPGWFLCQSSCYYISAKNDTVTWRESQDRCSDLARRYSADGYRLAVNDVSEQKCINLTLSKQPSGSPPYWTGLNDLQVTNVWQYMEAFNSPPNKQVISWAKEPNNDDNNENCAIISMNGFYYDFDCNGKANFICERNIGLTSGAKTVKYATSASTITLLMITFYILGRKS